MTIFSSFSANVPPHYHSILAINCVHASNWFTHLQPTWQIDGQNDNSVLTVYVYIECATAFWANNTCIKRVYCSQHFKYRSNYSHVTFGIKTRWAGVSLSGEAANNVATAVYMVQVRYTGGGSFCYNLMNPWLIANAARWNCWDKLCKQVANFTQECCPHCEILYGLLYILVPRPLFRNRITCYPKLISLHGTTKTIFWTH